MIMNPDIAKDLSDTMNKLDRWDAQIRDNEMKIEKDDISDKMRQAALFALAPKAVVENGLAGRRDLDNYAKVRCMIDDTIRDKREARGAIKMSGRGQPAIAGRRPAEAQRDDVGLRGRSDRRRE